ncbi:MAG: SufS family cysteine desulfurase, partial [Planctomycetota bacterium]
MNAAGAQAAVSASTQPLSLEEVEQLRSEFPILGRQVRGRALAYLDNAATAQKPRCVIDAVRQHYELHNANVHRGVHLLSQEATQAYEGARAAVAKLLGAERTREIVFVRGATEAINLVAQAWARPRLGPGDEVLVTQLEHHSNIVPWKIVCEQTGATLRAAPIDDQGAVDLDAYADMLSERTKVVAFAHIANALGTVNPVEQMARLAKERGAVVLVDGAQAAPHTPIDVRRLGCDFYAITGHKLFGPTGVGALWARGELLEAMEPYQGGGEMIRSVSFDRVEWNEVPHKFEAGTPNIAGAVGLGAAISFLQRVGVERFGAWEEQLRAAAEERLRELPGVRIVGTAPGKAAIVSFDVQGAHPHDVGAALDELGVAVRTGHHCAQPALERFGLFAT